MKKNFFAAIAFLLVSFPPDAAAEPAVLLTFSGKVEVSVDAEADYQPAVIRMKIEEGGSIRTHENSGALVLMPNKTKIWLREKSALEIEQKKSLSSRINFLFGKLKVMVPHLLRKEFFNVRTPAAVCAVRGTEFYVTYDEDAGTGIYVLYGEVKMTYNIPPPFGDREVILPQGHAFHIPETGKAGKHTIMSKAEEMEGLEDWRPGLAKRERRNFLRKKEAERKEIRRYAALTRNSNDRIRSFTYRVKESDIEAGRTLKDIHGNLVRVDQRLMRPDNKTLQFFNLVKRPVYSYSAPDIAGRFQYNGGQAVSNRLDLMQINMVFNKDIPARIEEWAGFFDDGSVDPLKASFIAANKTDSNAVFFTAEYYLRDETRDELVNNAAVVGFSGSGDGDRDVLVTGIVSEADFRKIAKVDSSVSGFAIEDNGASDGSVKEKGGSKINGAVWGIKMTDASLANLKSLNAFPAAAGNSWKSDNTGDDRLYDFQADAYRVGGVNADGTINTGSTAVFWLARENYGIANDGSLADVSDFTDTGKDPFSLLKEHALESIVYVKNLDTTGTDTRSSICFSDYAPDGVSHNAENANIDLVIIPDLPVAAVQRMLPALDKFGN